MENNKDSGQPIPGRQTNHHSGDNFQSDKPRVTKHTVKTSNETSDKRTPLSKESTSDSRVSRRTGNSGTLVYSSKNPDKEKTLNDKTEKPVKKDSKPDDDKFGKGQKDRFGKRL